MLAVASGVVLLAAGSVAAFGPPEWTLARTPGGADPPAAGGLGAAPARPGPGGSGAHAQGEPPAVAPDPGPAAAGGGSACEAFPAFPDERCTGWQHTGVSLRDCPTTVTEDGATLDGCRFEGGVTIQARDVTISRSLVYGLVEPHDSLMNLTLVDVEIDGSGQADPHGEAAIGNGDYTCIRCHIHSSGRGANLDRTVRIEDSYLHGFVFTDGVHQTAIGSNGGTGFTIVHNNLECSSDGCSAALAFYGDFLPVEDALVEQNLFNTTGGFCIYGGSVEGKPFPVATGIRFLDNRFGKKYHQVCGQYGAAVSWGEYEGNVWRGNQWQDGSGPVDPVIGGP